MARAIPKKLLIHAVTYQYGPKTEDEWSNESYTSTRELKRVRVEPSGKLVTTKDNTEIQLSMLLFYDVRNSLPKGLAFDPKDNLDDGVIFNGTQYYVKNVDVLSDEKGVHHYEVGLV